MSPLREVVAAYKKRLGIIKEQTLLEIAQLLACLQQKCTVVIQKMSIHLAPSCIERTRKICYNKGKIKKNKNNLTLQMSWKPIPAEAPAKGRTKKTHIKKRFQKSAIYKKAKSPHSKVSYRLLQSVSTRILKFVEKQGRFNLQDLGDLITDMQRTIVTLQHRRFELFEKERIKQKKKGRRKMKPKFNIKKIQ